ncbi:N-acetylmuramoyl-L-alanine amidase [Staphylococcus caprae]|uniref:N-acetylmuramoyl-L-alanine amidase n=1 Tax=Staphylococcus caprae TaxID=29380 RepID=UPI003B223712
MLKAFSLVSTASIALMSLSLFYAPDTNAKGLSHEKSEFSANGQKPTSSQSGTQANALKKVNEKNLTSNPDDPSLPKDSKVNRYIIENHLQHSKIVKDPRMNNLPKNPYKFKSYIGIVIHEVGEDHRSLQDWVDQMYRTFDRAFVHAFVDNNEIHITAPSEYYVWGAGAKANPYFYQIELVRQYTFEDFAKSVNNQAWLAAYMLKQNGIKPTLADDNEGIGSIISHNAVSQYWGGTDHVDPIEYYARWGYDMHQLFELVKYHYDNIPG